MTSSAAASPSPFTVDTTPKPRTYFEKIGDSSWELREADLDSFSDVTLWHENPRLLPHIPTGGIHSEAELEQALRLTPGYDNLRKSIEQIGQMEPIYAWRQNDQSKYVVFEGATRVTILRELSRKHASGPNAGRFGRVKAKVLPPNFGLKERVILLARIHVRGSGVRAWGRYIEAKFINDNVAPKNGEPALMSVSEMATFMEKSISWVQRLRDAYQFAMKFVEHVDDPSAEQAAVKWFSVLEESSKAAVIGSQLRDYNNTEHDKLRTEVFDMVQNEVFSEYRDARFLKQFYDDPDKWALLKKGERGIASRLAAEVKHSETGLKAKIVGLDQAIERAEERGDHGLDEQDLVHLRRAVTRLGQVIHGVDGFRLGLREATNLLANASLANVKVLTSSDLDEFREASDYMKGLFEKYVGPQ